MKQGYTDITVVIDKSISMSVVRDEVIAGFNAFVEEQKKVDGHVTLTLVQFDTEYDLKYTARDLQSVENLTHATYAPSGWTALHDAFGITIKNTGDRLSAMPESERPDKVIFVLQTDGEENSSKEYTLEHVREMVTHQKENYNWDFLFFGADIDALDVGRSFGIHLDNTIQFNKSKIGTANVFAATSSKIATYRSTGDKSDLIYSDDDRIGSMAS